MQGYVRWDRKVRPTEKRKLPKPIRWTSAHGNGYRKKKYGSKEGDFRTNMEMPEELRCLEVTGWQPEVAVASQAWPIT